MKNKANLPNSLDEWNFAPKGDYGPYYIENISKNKVLGSTNDYEIIEENFEEGKIGQEWVIEPNAEGYLAFLQYLPNLFFPKLLTANSDNSSRSFDFKGNLNGEFYPMFNC